MHDVTIIGGGLAGLVAAIAVAERGGRVTLHENRSTLGGRAQTRTGSYKTNLGPHALYTGEMTQWLSHRELMPPTIPPADGAFNMVWRGVSQPFPPVFASVINTLSLDAPGDRDFGAWATEHMGSEGASAAAAYLSLPTFHAEPEKCSAAFCQYRLQRTFQPGVVNYVIGGWAALIASLEQRVRESGVEIMMNSRISELPRSPTIIATDLPSAAKLLGKKNMSWPRSRTALFDLAVKEDERDSISVLDLDRRVYAVRMSRYDSSLAPAGEQVIQCSAGVRDSETLADAIGRIEGVLDTHFPSWRSRRTWSHQSLFVGASPIDLPGHSWCDRPAVEQGDNVWMAGDCVAAPGLLSEVAVASAIIAADKALHA